jgi:hypothetical protein
MPVLPVVASCTTTSSASASAKPMNRQSSSSQIHSTLDSHHMASSSTSRMATNTMDHSTSVRLPPSAEPILSRPMTSTTSSPPSTTPPLSQPLAADQAANTAVAAMTTAMV